MHAFAAVLDPKQTFMRMRARGAHASGAPLGRSGTDKVGSVLNVQQAASG